MKEIPILFSTPMVEAIISDRKTETRRTRGLDEINENPDDWKQYIGDYFTDKKGKINQKFFNGKYSTHAICPYGKPGDLLWVRETFKTKYIKGCLVEFKLNYPKNHPWLYFANEKDVKGYGKWKPSINMPKSAARIWLRVTEIKVERLQDITEESAIAEGVMKRKKAVYKNQEYWNYLNKNWQQGVTPFFSFKTLWQSINGEDSWNANPWVWVVKFEVVSKIGKPNFDEIDDQDKALPKPHSFCETPEEKCTMNYCDENGCMNRKRNLVEQNEIQ